MLPIPEFEEAKRPEIDIDSTRAKAKMALAFCEERNFNKEISILIDMSLHSGVKRFILWDFQKDTILHSAIVSHGCCDHLWSSDLSRTNPIFSNIEGSHCSSLGKYRVGERGVSSWGVKIKYALHGLETTNSNAYERFIVFHSWDLVPEAEVYPDGSPEGWGCPSVSNESFLLVDEYLKDSKKPILFWIYQ